MGNDGSTPRRAAAAARELLLLLQPEATGQPAQPCRSSSEVGAPALPYQLAAATRPPGPAGLADSRAPHCPRRHLLVRPPPLPHAKQPECAMLRTRLPAGCSPSPCHDYHLALARVHRRPPIQTAPPHRPAALVLRRRPRSARARPANGKRGKGGREKGGGEVFGVRGNRRLSLATTSRAASISPSPVALGRRRRKRERCCLGASDAH